MCEEQWQEVLERLKMSHSTLYGIARMSTMVYRDECIELSFKFLFHQKRVADPKALQIIANEASKLLNRDVTVKIVREGVVIGEAVSLQLTTEVTTSAREDTTAELLEIVRGLESKGSSERIYLKHAHISNFRAITNVDIEFNPSVNIIIGANNIGKSAIVDAIRLALQVGRYRKTKFVTLDDFNNSNEEIAIDLKFFCPDSVEGLPELKIFEVDESGKRKAYLELHVRYRITGVGEARQVRQQFWGGNTGTKVPDDEALDIFAFDYLGALRDAELVLKPSTKSKIADLLLSLRADKIDRKKIEEVFEEAQKHPEIQKLVTEANTSVQSHVTKIALKNDVFSVSFQPLPPVFEDLVGGFDVRLLSTVLTSTVGQNGLGYNNILYTSTVLGHIKTTHVRDPGHYHALLIEEPEAHLHPQLEDSLFTYLSSLGGKIGSQVIVTSHSPIISSTTNIDNLIIVHKKDNQTSNTNLSKINLNPDEKRKISRYMDVTKSQLFFAASVLFVEGITESLLLPKLADVFFQEQDSLLSRGIEVVDIDGVSFEPYAKLFNNSKASLPMRAAIITDRDSYTDKKGVSHDMSARTARALTFKGHHLDVQITEGRTFENDLWAAGNEAIMQEAGGKLFTRSSFSSADDILRLIDNSSIYGKGDLAQEIIELRQTLKVPTYIQNALKWVNDHETH